MSVSPSASPSVSDPQARAAPRGQAVPLPQGTTRPRPPDFRPSGLWVALLTPFRAGAVDQPALAALVQRLVRDGIDGLVVCGSTGEAAALTEDEKHIVFDTVAHAAPGLPLIAGLSSESQREALHWAHAVTARHPAVRAVLAPAPSYVRPSQAGLIGWFQALADAAHAPLVIYDIPYRTGSRLELETLRTLARDPRFVGIKDCSGDAIKVQHLIHDGALAVMAGEDAQAFATLALGGAGAILASAHVATRHWVRLVAMLRAGDLQAAQAQWRPLLPLVEALFAEPNPAVIKAVLADQDSGATGETRPPLTDASETACLRALNLVELLPKE